MADGPNNTPVIPAPQGTFATARRADGSTGFLDVLAFSATGDPLVAGPDAGRLIPLREWLELKHCTYEALCGP